MCKVTAKGIEFEDGEILPRGFTAQQFADLSTKNIEELASSKASLLSQIELRESVHDLINVISVTNELVKTMQEDLNEHIAGSITIPKINELIGAQISEHAEEFIGEVLSDKPDTVWEKTWHASNDRWFKAKFFSFVGIIKSIAVLIVSLGVIFGFIAGAVAVLRYVGVVI